MPLFPVHRPRIGLSFTGRSISLVELSRNWLPGRQRPKIVRTSEHRLPDGLLRPFDNTLNISNISALAQEIRALVGPRRSLSVALSLPDQSAQIGLFEFDSLPRQTAECEALLRWRFRNELNVPAGDTRILFRSFRSPNHRLLESEPSAPKRHVLAISIRREILNQYEQACEEAGLLPVSIGLSTVHMLNLCRTIMPAAEELFFANCTSEGFAFVAVRQGCPVFLRIKSLRQNSFSLGNELIATLQFYDDQDSHEGLSVEAPPRRLFLVSAGANGEWQDETLGSNTLEPSLVIPARNVNWRIQVNRVGWSDFPVSCSDTSHHPASGLPALAGAVGG